MLRPPKSSKANRWLSIDDGTAVYLQQWKELQEKYLTSLGITQTPSTPVCTNDLGDFLDPTLFYRWRRVFFVEHGFGRFTKEIKFIDKEGKERTRATGYEGYSYHELRHTQATLLIGSGADIKTVQNRLGHSSASLTMNIYAQRWPKMTAPLLIL